MITRSSLLVLCLALTGCTVIYQGGSPVRQNDNIVQNIGDNCNHYGPGTYQCNPTYDNTAMQVNGPCDTNCGVNRGWWSSGFTVRPLTNSNTLGLSVKYAATAFGGGDWHGYLCAQLTDTTTFQQILWCGETWRSDGPPHGSTSQGWDPTISGDTPSGIGTPPDGGFTVWTATPSGSWTLTGAQLQSEISQMNLWLPAIVASYGLTEHFSKYSTNPADYAIVSIQCGQEGTGPAGSGVTASCDSLKAAYG